MHPRPFPLKSLTAAAGLLVLGLACGGAKERPSGGSNADLSGSVTLLPPNYSGQNFWVAYQDGEGPWLPVLSSGGQFTFQVNDRSGRYGVALVGEVPGESSPAFVGGTLFHFTRGEATRLDFSTRRSFTYASVNGTISGVTSTDNANIAFGGRGVIPAQGATTYALNAPVRTADLLAGRMPGGGAIDRLVVQREVAITGPTTLPPMDFATQGWALIPQTLKVSGATSSDASLTFVDWLTPSSAIPLAETNAASLAFGAVPSANHLAGDFHVAAGQADDGTTGISRRVGVYSKSPTSLTLALPQGVTLPSFGAAATSPYFRPTITWRPVPGTLLSEVFLQDTTTVPVLWTLRVSIGWLGGTANPTYAFPDFTALAGWKNAWGFTPGNNLSWAYQNRATSAPDEGYFTGGTRSITEGRSFWATWVSGTASATSAPGARPTTKAGRVRPRSGKPADVGVAWVETGIKALW